MDRNPDPECKNEEKKKICYIHSDDILQKCNTLMRIPNRADMVHSLIEAYGLLNCMSIVEPRQATDDELLGFHATNYIEFLHTLDDLSEEDKCGDEAEEFGLVYDCPIQDGVFHCASLVGGATITAAEKLVSGESDIAINWYGGWHHAHRDSASGFCYINDVVLGILKLRQKFDRVLYIDLDLHHGDGVEEAFCCTNKVLTLSFHKYSPGFFPGTGSCEERGYSKGKYYSVNVPLLDGLKDEEFYSIFYRIMCKVKEVFKPEAVVCQCGADGLEGDPMQSFNLSPSSLGQCIQYIMSLNKPLVLLGGGGYNFINTAKCWTYLTSIAINREISHDIPDHKYFSMYGPDFDLTVSVGNRSDSNTREYLHQIYTTVIDNLEKIGS
ncbi:histone deacetylase 8 isoform X1 [Patella vulgata]|uniref:histone deacetylase 8 isoform X1 n=1 Tax=Patella vulgata TaxID=6465 RepID=UPI002180941C|nr:histone deacetylase 8 isoform X1 [Patella vulgata]